MASTTTANSRILKGALLTGAALLAWRWLSKSSSAKSLIFLPGSVNGIYFDGITPYVRVGIIVQNTSNQSYTINSIAGNVTSYQNGKSYNIGNVSTFTQQQILANKQQTILIDVRLSLIGVVSDLLNIIDAGYHQKIIFNGYANVENLQIPLNFEYTL